MADSITKKRHRLDVVKSGGLGLRLISIGPDVNKLALKHPKYIQVQPSPVDHCNLLLLLISIIPFFKFKIQNVALNVQISVFFFFNLEI